MALLDKLKDEQDKKYISFWELIVNIINVGDENHLGDENYSTVAEALLRLKLHEKVRYFVYDPDNFNFEQVNESETNEAKSFLSMLLPSSGKKLMPIEVINIQNQFKDYFWLKKSIEQVLPDGIVDFTNPRFFGAGKHHLLKVKPSYMSYGSSNDDFIVLQQQNQYLQERISELEAKQSNGSLVMGTPAVGYGKPKTNEQLNQELITANAKIADLEKQLSQQADVPADDSILQTILDESHKYHAPDLKHAIQLWNDLYINGLIGSDSHSNKANLWINNNTSYGNNTINSSVKRLREVSTPLKDFGGQRSKEIKK